MSNIIFNYEFEDNKILIFEHETNSSEYVNNFYKIDLFDFNKDKMFWMLNRFYGFGNPRVFPFKIVINNEFSGPGANIKYLDIYSYFTAEKFYNYINIQRFGGKYMPWVIKLWDEFEISKLIDGWKKYNQLEYAEKIEKIYNSLIIKEIIE